MPLGPACQVSPIFVAEIGVATNWVGAQGSASVVADTMADIGETFPPVPKASSPK